MYHMPGLALVSFFALFYVHIITSACYNFELTTVNLSPITFRSVEKAYTHKSMGERKQDNKFLMFNSIPWIFLYILANLFFNF